jgi:O-antigen/teichoic acid export membrane protein
MALSTEVEDRPVGSNQERVARNAGIYFVIQLVSWAVTFVTMSIIPRFLGEKVIGEVGLAGATTALVFGFGSLCIDQFLTREVGRDHHQADRLVRATLGLRLILFLPIIVVTWLNFRWVHATSHEALRYLNLYGSIMVIYLCINQLAEPLRSVLAGRERALQVSLSDLLCSAAPLLTLPFLRYGGIVLPLATLIATCVVFVLRAGWVRSQVRLIPQFDVAMWGYLIRGSLPFMLNVNLANLYSYTSLRVLEHFLGTAAIGQYSQATRLVGTFMFLPSALCAALLPTLSRMAQADPDNLKSAQLRILIVLIVCALPVTAGVMLLADPLCHLLYGRHQYLDLPLGLKYASLTILPLYIVSTIYQFLVAQGRNAIWSAVLFGTVVTSTLVTWFMVPVTIRYLHNGIIGAALGNVIAETVASVCAFVLLKNNVLNRDTISRVLRGVVATAGMSVVIWLMRDGIIGLHLRFWLTDLLALVLPAIAGAIVFVCLVMTLRALPPQEQELIAQTIRRKVLRRS